ncbi:Dabb family protein [Lacisediminihabitans sp.]|uniref:Dabb family protein n=1 Tax=Lacisediminihabitans sp. TaxID=2787631 RepID=UPI00374CDFD9
MLKHVVCWKIVDADSIESLDVIGKIEDGLRALVGTVPSIRALDVGPSVLTGPNHWDLALIVDFDNEAGLEEYQVHPAHQKLGAYIRSVVSEQATVDFIA